MGLTARDYVKTEQATFAPPEAEIGIEIVPFGIWHVDARLPMGIKPTSPKLITIQGGSGSRKTTLMLNFIVNMCLSGLLPVGHKIIYDTLENGFTIERSLLTIRAIVATRYILYRHYTGWRDIESGEPVCDYLRQLFAKPFPENKDPAWLIQNVTTKINGQDVYECAFSPDFIEAWYYGRVRLTPTQNKAWLIAGDAISTFPLEFFGVSEHPDFDTAESRSTITINIAESYRRWSELADSCESLQVVTDYLQEYWLETSAEHYQKQLTIVPWLSRFIKERRKTVWCLSQEGIQHQRDYQSKGVVLGSSGGDILKAASQINWRVSYNKDTSPYYMVLHAPVKMTRGNHPDLKLMIEPNSGAIFGKSEILER